MKMSFYSYFRKILNTVLWRNNDETTVDVPSTAVRVNKRCSEEILNNVITVKRRKISYDSNFPKISHFSNKEHKENNIVSTKQNRKMNETSNKLPVNHFYGIYCIDDDDDSITSKRTLKEFNRNKLINRFNSFDNIEAKSFELPTNSTIHTNKSRGDLCLTKVLQKQEEAKYTNLLKNHTPVLTRKSIPLTSGMEHNKKENNQIFLDSFNNPSYSCRRRTLISNNKFPVSVIDLTNPKEEISDKCIIDLTVDESDEDERKMIESNVVCLPAVKNLKSNFIGQNNPAFNEDFLTNLVKKYDLRMQTGKLRALNIEKDLRKKNDAFYKILSEKLDKQLTLKEHSEKEENIVEQRPCYEVIPITKSMIAEINQIIASKKIPLIRIKDTDVKLEDIRTLENTSWLNDGVINAYMNLIQSRAEKNKEKYPKVYCFNTFLYEQLNKKGYDSVRRWTKKIDIFDFQILIVPIHLGNHWCLTEINFKKKCIRYYDSMGTPNSHCLETIKEYLCHEYTNKKNGTFDVFDWQLINVPRNEIPQQKNAHDCGVFACTYAEHITRNAYFNFHQEHMPYFRIKMMYEILTGKLLF